MKKRIHIHQERITINGELRNFLIHLPADTGRIVSLKATAFPLRVFGGGGALLPKGHFDVGRLRVAREGVLLWETEVIMEDKEAQMMIPLPPGLIDNDLTAFSIGAKSAPQIINASCETRVLSCKFQGGPLIKNYTLSIYITYRRKDENRICISPCPLPDAGAGCD